ncbi:helix-turn-helix transcriptional regulator [Paenibacillus camelliae]|uniref:helix-turn-helix transcriptional regulator n=1 Tax=Paenibacillus camelliae TaxID=512410 RepID=UPI00203A781A|nr:AraC family transcriptional regulator [Paenibacillus camelliae]MCM3633359.1 AraC family transcriptional regulator [Paenibacillus camelliae]
MNIEAYHNLVPNIFLFNERKCFPDWIIAKRKNDFHDLTFVIDGKANYYINGVKYTVEAGDLLYIPAGMIREAHTFEASPMHAFPFNFHWEAPYNDFKLPFDIVTKQLITKEILDYIREFKHVWITQQPLYQLHARALFELILHRLLANFYRISADPIDPRVTKMMRYVNEHYAHPLSVKEVAELLQLHPVYVGKLFKKHTGTTFKEYLNRVRVNHAEMMLSSGDFTVTETAERCGFYDVSYFSNLFKAMKGYPPSTVSKPLPPSTPAL